MQATKLFKFPSQKRGSTHSLLSHLSLDTPRAEYYHMKDWHRVSMLKWENDMKLLLWFMSIKSVSVLMLPITMCVFLKHCWKDLNFPLRKWINNSHQLALQSSSAGRLKSCLSFTSILHTQCLEFWVCARWNQFSSFNAAECVYLFNFQHYFILARCYFSFTLFLLKFDNGKLIACMFRKKLNSSDLFIYSITKFTIPTNALRTFS